VSEAAVGAVDATRSADEAAAAATSSTQSNAAARRDARDALSPDEFRRGMELAGIAGQVQVAAELLQGVSGNERSRRFSAARATCSGSLQWPPSAGPPRVRSSPTERSTSPLGLRARVFTEVGAGVLDVRGVLATLAERDYRGWIVVERDTTWRPPFESAAMSRVVINFALRRLASGAERAAP
jgi:hypothetical protein